MKYKVTIKIDTTNGEEILDRDYIVSNIQDLTTLDIADFANSAESYAKELGLDMVYDSQEEAEMDIADFSNSTSLDGE